MIHFNPGDDMPDEFQPDDAWSEERCRDMSFLEARCRDLGLPKLEKALRLAAGKYGGVVAAIHWALRAEAHWLQLGASALPARIYDRLRSSGWEVSRIERELRFPSGLPAPRLRHAAVLSDAELTLEGHEAGIWACAVTPDGRRLISASRDKTLRVWDLHSGEMLAVLRGHEEEVRSCAVMPNGRRIVSASSDTTLKIWDLETGQALATLTGHQRRVLACAITSDGRRIVSASSDRTLRIWDAGTGEALATLVGHEDEVRHCAVTPDDRRIVSTSPDGSLKVWSMDTGEALATIQTSSELKGRRCPCAVSPDGTRVVVASGDALQVRNLETLELIATFGGYTGNALACVVTPDSRLLVSASEDRTLRVWELATGKEIEVLRVERFGHLDIVLACAVTPDGRHIVNASWDQSLRVWSLDASRPPAVMTRMNGPLRRTSRCMVTPDGPRAVSLSRDWTLRVWSLDTGKLLKQFGVEPREDLRAMATGDRRAVIQSKQGLHALDLETGRDIATLMHDDAELGAHAVVRGDRWIVFYTLKERGIHIWDLETFRTLTLAEAGRAGCVTTPAQRSALLGRSIMVWDEAGRLLSTVDDADPSTLRWVAAPDGRHLITSTKDLSRRFCVRVTATGREIITIAPPEPLSAPYWSFPTFAVTPDNRRLVTGTGKAIGVWDLNTGASVAIVYVDWPVASVAATNEVLCAHDYFGNQWVFELPPQADEASRDPSE
jgi:WD40 repeat protein